MCAVVKNYEYLQGKNRSSFNLWPFAITRGTTGSLANTMLQKMAINGNYHLSTSLISSNWFFSGSMFLLGKHFLQSRNICYQLINRNIKNRRYFYKTTDTLFTWMWLNWTNHVHMVFTFTFFSLSHKNHKPFVFLANLRLFACALDILKNYHHIIKVFKVQVVFCYTYIEIRDDKMEVIVMIILQNKGKAARHTLSSCLTAY